MNKQFNRIECCDFKLGMRFSAPVFFDDGVNMFLAEGKTAKPYHIAALKRWNVPFLLSFGHVLDDKIEPVDVKIDDIDELEEVEELEEVV